ncbi:MAG: hypothetical protein IIA73_09390 [Proteobacteria bacterium]|nr:hypothetical protein [Pseudomonadota bacterium]
MTNFPFLADISELPDAHEPTRAATGLERWRTAGAEAGEQRLAAALAADPVGEALLRALFGNSPFLAQCALKEVGFVHRIADAGPDAGFEAAVSDLAGACRDDANTLMRRLRLARRRVALAVGIADITGAWAVERVTGALTGFAEAALGEAVSHLLLEAAAAGEIDLAHRIGPDLANSFKDKEGFKVVVLPDVRIMVLEVPLNASVDPITGGPNPWRDKRVRQAANYAIDTDSIIKNLLTGNEERAYSPFSAGYPLPLGSLEAQYNYDPERARALLEEAGQVGFEFEILLATGLWTADTVWMPAIQQMLNDVGFKVTVDYKPLSEALSLMRENQTRGPFIFNQGGIASAGAPLGPAFAYALVATTGAPYSHAQEGDDFLPEHVAFPWRLAGVANAKIVLVGGSTRIV